MIQEVQPSSYSKINRRRGIGRELNQNLNQNANTLSGCASRNNNNMYNNNMYNNINQTYNHPGQKNMSPPRLLFNFPELLIDRMNINQFGNQFGNDPFFQDF